MTPEVSSCLPYAGVANVPPGVTVCWNESARIMEFGNVAPGDRVEFRSDEYCAQPPTASGAEEALCEMAIRSANLTNNPDVFEEPVGARFTVVVETNGDGKLKIIIPPVRNGEEMFNYVPDDPNHDYSQLFVATPTPVPVLTQESPNYLFPDVPLVLGVAILGGFLLYFTVKRVFPPGSKTKPPTFTSLENPPQRQTSEKLSTKPVPSTISKSPETKRILDHEGPNFQSYQDEIIHVDPALTVEYPPFDWVVNPGVTVIYTKKCDSRCPVLTKVGPDASGVCVSQPDNWRIEYKLPLGYQKKGPCEHREYNNIVRNNGNCWIARNELTTGELP